MTEEAKISPTQVVKVVQMLLEPVRLEMKALRDELNQQDKDLFETRKIVFALHERLDLVQGSVSKGERL